MSERAGLNRRFPGDGLVEAGAHHLRLGEYDVELLGRDSTGARPLSRPAVVPKCGWGLPLNRSVADNADEADAAG